MNLILNSPSSFEVPTNHHLAAPATKGWRTYLNTNQSLSHFPKYHFTKTLADQKFSQRSSLYLYNFPFLSDTFKMGSLAQVYEVTAWFLFQT